MANEIVLPFGFDDAQGRARRVSTQEAALLKLRYKALKGDARSLDRLLGLAEIYNDSAPPAAIDFDRPEDALVMDGIVQHIRKAAEAPLETDCPEDDIEKSK
jgi:hypothetical protein